jgi:hypothetical protein
MSLDNHLSESVTISGHQWLNRIGFKIVANVRDADRT